MGYPVSYRTSAARRERQLSRPDPAPAPRSPANDNYRHPTKPANDNFPANLPPKPGSWVKNPAVKRAAKLAMQVHPGLRVLRYLWDLYDLYNWYKNTRTGLGNFILKCTNGSIATHCITPGVCNGTAYCYGPVFGDGTNFCPTGSSFSFSNAYGSAEEAAHRNGGTNGFHVILVRPSTNLPQPCSNQSAVINSYEKTFSAGQRRANMPHLVPFTHSIPPFWAPFRWYKPEVLMKPQVDYDVTPQPPPYRMVPDREMGPNSDRGYEISEAPAPLSPPFAYRGPPPRGTKEKKVRWDGPARILHSILISIARVHGKLADLRDLVGALHKSLPKHLQVKGKDKKSLHKMLRAVWDNMDQMNGEQALLNIIEELAEDVIGGAGDRMRSAAAKEFGWVKNKIFTSPRF